MHACSHGRHRIKQCPCHLELRDALGPDWCGSPAPACRVWGLISFRNIAMAGQPWKFQNPSPQQPLPQDRLFQAEALPLPRQPLHELHRALIPKRVKLRHAVALTLQVHQQMMKHVMFRAYLPPIPKLQILKELIIFKWLPGECNTKTRVNQTDTDLPRINLASTEYIASFQYQRRY